MIAGCRWKGGHPQGDVDIFLGLRPPRDAPLGPYLHNRPAIPAPQTVKPEYAEAIPSIKFHGQPAAYRKLSLRYRRHAGGASDRSPDRQCARPEGRRAKVRPWVSALDVLMNIQRAVAGWLNRPVSLGFRLRGC